MIMELELGEGGFVPAPPEYVQMLAGFAKQHGILFIADEIQTGFGRTGQAVRLEHYGLVPDIIITAKSLAGGLPLAAVTGRADVMEASQVGGLGGTYGGNPLACAAALAVLDAMERESIPAHAARSGARIAARFREWASRFACIGDVRGLGAMVGMELVTDRESRAPDKALAGRLVAAALERGVILLSSGTYGNTIRVLAPLTAERRSPRRGARRDRGGPRGGGGAYAGRRVTVDRARVRSRLAHEERRFADTHPRSRDLHARARRSLLGGVPMHWMTRWAGGFPIFADHAAGAYLVDVDGHRYLDLCLGDTGAMTGHVVPAVAAAIASRSRRGLTFMLPTEDAVVVAEELTRRFGLPWWQFAVTATDANRFAIRLARQVTGRRTIVVFNWCYHGTVDETFATLRDGVTVARAGNIGPPVDPGVTTRVVEFNDVAALEAALAPGDVACVLAEPAMTNIGIVLPAPGYHEALRAITRRTGTLLLIDETHTICAGPGGYTQAHRLAPDMLTLGKAVAGGVPGAVYGFSDEVALRISAGVHDDTADTGGIGGTLAANALSTAAMRATLESGPDGGELRGDDPAGRAVGGGRGLGDRGARPALDGAAAGLPGGVLVPGGAAGQRGGGGRGDGRRAGALYAPGGPQPRHPADAVSQHGAVRSGGDRGRRGSAHGRLPGERRAGSTADRAQPLGRSRGGAGGAGRAARATATSPSSERATPGSRRPGRWPGGERRGGAGAARGRMGRERAERGLRPAGSQPRRRRARAKARRGYRAAAVPDVARRAGPPGVAHRRRSHRLRLCPLRRAGPRGETRSPAGPGRDRAVAPERDGA